MADKKTNKRIETIVAKMLTLKESLENLKKKHTAEQNKFGEQYNKWEAKLSAIMKDENMKLFGSDSGLIAERKMTIFGTLKNPKLLHKFIVKNDAWDLLGSKVGTVAYRERINDGVKVPGVEQFKKYSINVKRGKVKKIN